MDIKTFNRLTEAYKSTIGQGKPSRNAEGKEITSQSQSIWFDRKTIMKLLEQSDEGSGGLKIFFAAYDKEFTDDPELIGKLTVVLAASNDNEDPTEESQIENGGRLCPPYCNGNI
ncbi:MAG TPA: hypothetical protein VK921_18575 [Anditalea sp.]|nr:hypothetical protein [Anditalea sp.]